MKILFICTAFNSLSQRLALVLRSQGHAVTIELALTSQLMISAAELAAPDVVVCPFLTKRVPKEVYTRWLTLIVHPGPPGDAGPSAIDWCLLGDTGELPSAEAQLALIDARHADPAAAARGSFAMRSHWGVTVLQAIEALDAGPIWAFDQFELDPETRRMTKSDLYRGPVTRCALSGVLAALDRIQAVAAATTTKAEAATGNRYPPSLSAPANAGVECVSRGQPFLGGKTHERPLLKASMRDFLFADRAVAAPISADVIVQRINSADSQPGVLTSLFGKPLFVYGVVVQRDPLPATLAALAREGPVGTVLATREGAVLVTVGSDLPIWICHVRCPKAKKDHQLHPKLPAVMGLLSMPELAHRLGLLDRVEEWSVTTGFGADPVFPWRRRSGTYQQVYVELEWLGEGAMVAYVYAEFYNGAFSTLQCEVLLEAIRWTLAQPGLKAIVMMGGTGYFSNGIALNVIEGSSDLAAEGWANINAIDDCVEALLAPAGVLTVSAMRGNAAAGGLAVATAADVVLSIEQAVHNPHYRGLGLYGSEWHTYSWTQRCGAKVASRLAREMLPISTAEAKSFGLVDHVLERGHLGAQAVVDEIKSVVQRLVTAKVCDVARDPTGLLSSGAPWTKALLPVVGEAVDNRPLVDRLVTNKAKYLAYLFAGRMAKGGVAGSGGATTPATLRQHFQTFRKLELDQMTFDFFHLHRGQRFRTRCTAFVRKLVPEATPKRFALHRRYETADWNSQPHDAAAVVRHDEEELASFDSLGDVPATEAVVRVPCSRPELLPIRQVRTPEIGHDDPHGSPMLNSPSAFSDASGESDWTAPSSAPPSSPRLKAKSLVEERCEARSHKLRQQRAAKRPAQPATDSMRKAGTAISFAPLDAVPAAAPTPTTKTARRASISHPSLCHDSSSRTKELYNRFVAFLYTFKKIDTVSTVGATSRQRSASISRSPSMSTSVPLSSTSRRSTSGPRPISYHAGSRDAHGSADRKSMRSSIQPASSVPCTPFLPSEREREGECLFSCYYAEDGSELVASLPASTRLRAN